MELFRALAVLAEPPTPAVERVARTLELGPLPETSEYTQLFLFQLYPYASVYLGPEGMLGGEARDRIAGFWRALELVPPAEPDHLALMLALYARLCELEEQAGDDGARGLWSNARRAFLWEHLLSWLPFYLDKLKAIAPPFYQRWGELLAAALFEEALRVERPELLPLHLREAARVLDPRETTAEAFIQSLLSPVRSGVILVRDDLKLAARKMGLALRLGERKFILTSLFGQDAQATLLWLAEEAAGWTNRHRRHRQTLGLISLAWEERASFTASLLEELGRAANEIV
ncbi:MAG TPA: molecular chaperone TorD family protein [Pyrinomonadaceae bacterium]|jgi:TorA maturation chaperone TorD